MRKITAALLVFAFLVCGNLAFAQEKCDCEKGGILGYPSRRVTLAVAGWKIIHSGNPDCITANQVGLTIGGIDQFISIGVGYDTGVVGFGIGIKGKEDMLIISPVAIGYDYGPCPVTFPWRME